MTFDFTSEEDLRSKILVSWLADHGFSAADITVEKSFEIQLGRGVFRVASGELLPGDETKVHEQTAVRPRVDLLVRHTDGRNLLVIEAKAPGHVLSPQDEAQAISYARLLRKGGIAPFAVLTNGDETRIIDVISGEQIEGKQIPTFHPHARAGFRVSGDDIALRLQALHSLISLTSENLLAFCKAQVNFRMRRLRGDNADGPRKYIPQTYVSREVYEQRLGEILLDGKHEISVVIGRPQLGKTCLICHKTLALLSESIPCLFYAAIDLQSGLLNAVREDFFWEMGDATDAYHVIQKICSTLPNLGRLIIMIDGMNEVDPSVSCTIDRDCQRLSTLPVTIAMSVSDAPSSLYRLFFDRVGNPTYVADKLQLNVPTVARLSGGFHKHIESTAIIQLAELTEVEYAHFLDAYQVTYLTGLAPGMNSTKNPLLVRAMAQLRSETGRVYFDESTLLERMIMLKVARTGLHPATATTILASVGELLLSSGSPVTRRNLRSIADDEALDKLSEAGLLVDLQNGVGLPSVDFYVDAERDYIVAYWLRDWQKTLGGAKDVVVKEMSLAGQSYVGSDALARFLSQRGSEDYLRNAVKFLDEIEAPSVRQTILSCVSHDSDLACDQSIVRKCIEAVIRDKDPGADIAITRLLFMAYEEMRYSDDANRVDPMGFCGHDGLSVTNIEEVSTSDHVLSILCYLVEAEGNHHSQCRSQCYGVTSQVTERLCKWLDHQDEIVRSCSVIGLAYIDPHILLREIALRMVDSSAAPCHYGLFVEAIKLAGEVLEDYYYGTKHLYCPSLISFVDDWSAEEREDHQYHVEQTYRALTQGYRAVPPEHRSAFHEIFELLGDICQDLQSADELSLCRGELDALRYQLTLAFEGL